MNLLNGRLQIVILRKFAFTQTLEKAYNGYQRIFSAFSQADTTHANHQNVQSCAICVSSTFYIRSSSYVRFERKKNENFRCADFISAFIYSYSNACSGLLASNVSDVVPKYSGKYYKSQKNLKI